MSLCKRCSSFNIQEFTNGGFRTRGYPLQAVIRAAKRDHCSFCSMLLEHLIACDELDQHSHLSREIRKEDKTSVPLPGFSWALISVLTRRLIAGLVPPWVHFSVKRSNNYRPHSSDSLNIVQLNAYVSVFADAWEWDSALTNTIYLNVAGDLGTPAVTSGDITGTLSLDQYTWSWSHYQAIHNWHRNCRVGHQDCNKTLSGCEKIDAEDAPLPTRCVEFDLVDKQNSWYSPIRWRLRETKGERGKYIALSHRWVPEKTGASSTVKKNYSFRINQWNHGPIYNTQPTQSTRDNITVLFSDVGYFACYLGMKYVWIDSICIVQDDAEDWARESIKMAIYYQHAWLTIAATITFEAGGMYNRHSNINDMSRITRLPYYNKNGEQNGHFYVQAAGNTAFAQDFKKSVSNSVLLKRGWVYQEWMLSRRILAISSSGLFLQCQSAQPKSLDGHEVLNRWEKGKEAGFVNLAFKQAMKLKLSSSTIEILNIWETVVSTYSDLQITRFEEDRLVALTGVAHEFGRALESRAAPGGTATRFQYICGLWTNWSRGMLWERVRPEELVRVKGFPTWSWLSIAGIAETDTAQETTNPLCGIRVQWAKPEHPYVKVTDICKFGTPISVPIDPESWTPQFENAVGYLPDNVYGNDNRFIILALRSHILPVQIGCTFDNPEDCEVAATMTGHTQDFGRSLWRGVSLVSCPQTIVGWASLESPAFQSGEPYASGLSLYALAVLKLAKVSHGYGLGHLSGFHSAYKVLFLNKVQVPGYEECYERIGVGRLFGDSVEVGFQAADEIDIKLV